MAGDDFAFTILRASDGEWMSFDIVLSEDHTLAYAVTKHRVEDGVRVSDHVTDEGPPFHATVVLTETPFHPQATPPPGANGTGRVADAIRFFRRAKGEVLHVGTVRYGTLDNMALTRVSWTVSNHRSATFELVFEPFRVVAGASIRIPARRTTEAGEGLSTSLNAGPTVPKTHRIDRAVAAEHLGDTLSP